VSLLESVDLTPNDQRRSGFPERRPILAESRFKESSKIRLETTAVQANMLKGNSLSFMANQAAWHGAAPNQEQFEKAMVELATSAVPPSRIERMLSTRGKERKEQRKAPVRLCPWPGAIAGGTLATCGWRPHHQTHRRPARTRRGIRIRTVP
jgi:hypothetical protein